jgi:hypothetical protein
MREQMFPPVPDLRAYRDSPSESVLRARRYFCATTMVFTVAVTPSTTSTTTV